MSKASEPTDLDSRLRDLPGTDTPFDPPMPLYASLDAWEQRKSELRDHILVAAGLCPTPPKTDLAVQVRGRNECDGYTVENVAFESRPGLFVTGNLYLPREVAHRVPGIACPHGHWKDGRLHNDTDGSVPARCVTLARMGNVVFAYDMLGYNDSLQLDHRFEDRRSRLWGISPLGIQLWNSIRVLDFLESRKEVDPERLACTGASGGGTQTFLLTAVDDRVKVSAPVNMISAHMQGGCICENAPHLRLHASNVEIGAMMAPRPMLMVSATGDWTKNTPDVEYPAIQNVYRLYGDDDKLAEHQVDAGHNFNSESREAVYEWMNRWLHPGRAMPAVDESLDGLPSNEALRVFPDGLPSGALRGDEMIDALREDTRARCAALLDNGEGIGAAPDSVLATAYRHVVNATVPSAVDVSDGSRGGAVDRIVLSRPGVGDAVTATHVAGSDPQASTVVMVHPDGKDACMEHPLTNALVAEGHGIIAIDAFRTGATAGVERPEDRHFHTFNHSDLANRIQDIVTAVTHATSLGGPVDLVGVRRAGMWAVLARPLLPDVRVTVAEVGGTDTVEDSTFEKDLYLPGIRLFSEMKGAAILTCPGELRIWNASRTGDCGMVRRAYRDAGLPKKQTIEYDPVPIHKLAAWLR